MTCSCPLETEWGSNFREIKENIVAGWHCGEGEELWNSFLSKGGRTSTILKVFLGAPMETKQ